MECILRKANLRVWIRREHRCPFNLYSTLGAEAYSLTASFPKEWSAKQAVDALLENGYEQIGGFAVVADVQVDNITRFEYTDRRYRYKSMRRALQTLSNLSRIQLGGKDWNWKIVHYYPIPA